MNARWTLLTVLLGAATSSAQTLNELRVDETDAQDPNEYVELAGTPGLPLTGMTLVVVGDGNGPAGAGVIEEVVSLGAASIPSDGHLIIGQSTLTIGTADIVEADLNLENADTLTLLVVTGFTGTDGQDLDADDNGTFDVTPWIAIIDSVSIVARASAEMPYAATRVGPTVAPDPDVAHIERCPDALGAWRIAPFTFSAANDSPGATNPCPAADAGTDAGTTDAGFVTDAGTSDAGTEDGGVVADAGEVDAGETPDAGEPTDAGELADAGEQQDAGELTDAGEEDAGTPLGEATGGGCGCTAVPIVELLAFLGLAAIARRRGSRGAPRAGADR